MDSIKSRNARCHILEGALYISGTSGLISAQTMMPSLIKKLGGNDVLVGTWPIVIYLAFFLPQVFSANYSSKVQFRKSIVMNRGLFQRLHVIVLAIVIALLGSSMPSLALILLFVIFISNQATGGSVSPIWMDFVAKTVDKDKMGKIMGWRTTLAASLGFMNGFILTGLLTVVMFPYNYSIAIALAFLYQIGSLLVQRNIIEEKPSPIMPSVKFFDLFSRIKSIVSQNIIFKKFLLASSLLTISFSAVAFYTVAGLHKFGLNESYVGIFTIITIIGQVLSGLILGGIADSHGTKNALIIGNISLLLSIIFAIFASSVFWFYFVFIFMGLNIGAEVFMRYNFAVECAPEKERAMYVGIMNAIIAPFYLISPLVGLISEFFGYQTIFALSLLFGIVGLIFLFLTPDPRKTLAISLK